MKSKHGSLCVVSFGGGVNSTAMLIGMQERGFRPDVILFANTGGEKPETYRHVNRVREWCVAVGFPEIVTVAYRKPGCQTLEQECLNNETLPSKAFGFGGCSVKWKRAPMDKWIGENGGKEYWEINERIIRCIGIHAGETKRGKIPDDDKYIYVYPLRDWGWFQVDCEAAHARAGIPLPCKSACFFCPAMKKAEVLKLAKEHPDLFERACEIERNAIESGNLETVKGLGRHWTWEGLVKADAMQQRLFDDCQAPLCDVCFDW